MCATDPVDVGGHIDIEFYNVLREHWEYLKKLFPFSRHLHSGSSRSITAARFNGINSSSPTSQFIGSSRPQRPDNGTFITTSTHSHPSCRKYCSHNTTFLLPCLVFCTDDSGPCSPDSMIGIIVHPPPTPLKMDHNRERIHNYSYIFIKGTARTPPKLLLCCSKYCYFCVGLLLFIFVLFCVLFVFVLFYVLLFLCWSIIVYFCVVLCIVCFCVGLRIVCFVLFYVLLFLCCSMYCLFCVVLFIVFV